MSRYYIYADRFFLHDRVEEGGYLEIANGKFGGYSKEKPSEEEILYRKGMWIAPGFVDTHIHGIAGHDVMDNNQEGLLAISKELVKSGVTSFLPTTLTADKNLLAEAAAMIGRHYKETKGAKIQGIFFEGPFFTERYKGAQNPKYFMNPDIEMFIQWQRLSGGLIKKIAIAPEREGAAAFTKKLTEMGVTVALGHSAASYEQAKEVVDAGASVFVHTFNGMSQFSHREPGMAGCAMSTENTVAEVICDGFHVHPAAVKVLVKAKTPDKTALITDCMRAGSMPDGDYMLGELPVIVEKGAARLKSNGSLAGSVLRLNVAVRNVIDWKVADDAQAIRMASYVPAKSVGIEDRCGSITTGYDADFIALSPEIDVLETWVNGVTVYQKK